MSPTKTLIEITNNDISRHHGFKCQTQRYRKSVVRSNLNRSYFRPYNRKSPGMGFGNSRMIQGGEDKTRCTISKSTSTLCVPSLPYQVCQIPSWSRDYCRIPSHFIAAHNSLLIIFYGPILMSAFMGCTLCS